MKKMTMGGVFALVAAIAAPASAQFQWFENFEDGLFSYMVVEIVEGGESTLAGAIRVLEQTKADAEAVLQALRDASTDQAT